ncbi:MAG TPA: hypothetical protein VKE69_06245, partial [Planctomycetota bacterium]|nr:hypothetical protein [Planctomycetota bacterium]
MRLRARVTLALAAAIAVVGASFAFLPSSCSIGTRIDEHGRRATPTSVVPASTAPAEAIVAAGRSAIREDARAREDASATLSEEASDILVRLRQLAPQEGFHGAAWPLVERLAAIGRASPRVLSNLDSLVEAREAEHERVRGAALLAACRARRGDEGRTVARSHRDEDSREVQRAAWIALALSGPAA